MNHSDKFTNFALEDEVVISGIAGRFPESDNIKHFQEHLFNKADLGSDDCRRWQHDHPDIPKRTGKINNIDKFDAEYFNIPFNEAHLLDPMCRCLLEHTYEAIVDAGINPNDLRGTNTGVIVGTSFSESEKTMVYVKTQLAGLSGLGCRRSMQANRISYWLGITGPSYTIDTACSSSLYAMEQAYRIIRSGKCDSMIVAATNLCLNPVTSLQFMRLGVLSLDGYCRPFDVDANGYMRSEAIAVVYLQKAKDAKRIYATVVYSKTNCDGFKEEGINFPSTKMQSLLFEEFYNECNISPSSIGYIEAHGTGTKVGDPEEVNAIESVFCKDRQGPLLIGSNKSNCGHPEPVSGLLQIFKVIIAMETGAIPPNIHFTKGRDDIEAFKRGTIQVVCTTTSWEPTLAGINSFGFGGANGHTLLGPNKKRKINGGAPKDKLPRLVVLSGRTKEATESFLHKIESKPIDVEYIRLLHDIFADEMQNHPYRGYTIVDSRTSGKRVNQINYYPGVRKPVCFAFSGIGPQWFGMEKALLQFPAFSKSVEKCNAILQAHGVRIIDDLISKQEAALDNILNSIVGIVVMQLGLIDLLRSVNIAPDYVIGHSIGELCCGYATGDFTLEQVILAAYRIGLALTKQKVTHYAMINNNYKGVDCNNVSVHSRHLEDKILAYLHEIIPQKMTHNNTWHRLSRDTDLSYAEYFTNNFMRPALFEEITALIPRDAVFVEMAPARILHNVSSKQSLNTTTIALTQRGHNDNVQVFLQGLGKMYNCGLQPKLASLYPTVEFPVSRGTPMISPSIKWNHSENWYVSLYTLETQITTGELVMEINLQDESYEYMSGHVIDGKNLLPAMGYIELVWKMIGMLNGKLYNQIPVVFEDIKFLRATLLSEKTIVELTLMMQKSTGNFEIIEGGSAIVTGRVHVPSNPDEERVKTDYLKNHDDEEETMKTKDIYKELKLRGYQYNGLFCGLKSSSITGNRGHIEWMNNWVIFMDNMLHISILGIDTRSLRIPTRIRKLLIDPKIHTQHLKSTAAGNTELEVKVYRNSNIIISGGVEIHGLDSSIILRKKVTESPVLEANRFVAYYDEAKVSFMDVLTLSMHLTLEYHQTTKVDIMEIVEDGDETIMQELASPLFAQILSNLPLVQPNITLVNSTASFDQIDLPPQVTVSRSKQLPTTNNAILITGCNLLDRGKNKALKDILPVLKANGFLLTRGRSLAEDDLAYAEMNNLVVVLKKRTEKECITLMKKRDQSTSRTEVIRVNNREFSWLEQLKSIMNDENKLTNSTRIIMVGEGDAECGLHGLVNCLRKESGGELIRGVFVQDENAPKFSLQDPFYAQQLRTDLIMNVLRPGKIWGSYRHLPLEPLKPKSVYHAFVNQTVRGDLTSFRWLEGPITRDQYENLVNIIYASLNFKDVMIATNKINLEDSMLRGRLEDCMIGFEYSGIDHTGRRIMGMYETRCFSNRQVIDEYLSWEVPNEWTLEDAATVPCAYATSYYGLYIRGQLKKGEKVLIHSGTGAVGQAAIRIALHDGCEVFTTVSTLEKRKFIRNTFPSIPESHIGYSRDISFEQMIRQQTDGRGVDVVLNSLAEDKLQASLRCLGRGGRFLEIGKFDIMSNNTLAISAFSKEIKFYGVMLDRFFNTSVEEKRHLNTIVAAGLNSGAVKPIARKIFQKDDVENAFRYIAAGKHIGKIIIKVQEEKTSAAVPISALPRYYCLPNKTYIILGGLGGFGLELADWLVARGAMNLVFVSRSGMKNGYQRMRIKQWESYGVRVLILSNVDISSAKGCEHVLRTAEELAPVDAIFNLAVVLNDKTCPNHTIETFQEPFKAKAWATKNMDQLSRKLCRQLRSFVVFSSVSCGRGNAGQSNYGMANSVMERICERRSQEGLHGLAIQWGAVGDVGIVADMQADDKEMVIGGTLQQKVNSCIEKLEEFLLQGEPVVASMVVAEKRSASVSGINVIDTIANIMGLKTLDTVSTQTRLSELGMDSMMTVEIKQALEREHAIFLTARDIRNLSFADLTKMFDQKTTDEELRSGDALNANDATGLKLLIRSIGTDLTADICMNLSTKNNGTTNEIFLLPGIEGCGSVFKSLGPKIEASATCLQYGTYNVGNDCETIAEIADNLFQHMAHKINSKRDFFIVAYSYGTLIAVELARKLESIHLKGRLVFVDGAPEQVKTSLEQYIIVTTNDELQNNVLLSIMDILEPALSGKLLLKLHKLTDWDDKLNTFVKDLSSNYAEMSAVYIKSLCSTIYKHVHVLQKYDITQLPRITSSIVLFKPTMRVSKFPLEDYGLHKITTGSVEVYSIEGDHITILDSDKVVATINGLCT